jgi:hypothetical protein
MATDISTIRNAQISEEKSEEFFAKLDDLIALHIESGTDLKNVIATLHITLTAMTQAYVDAVYGDEDD